MNACTITPLIFEVPSITDSKDMIKGHDLKYGLHNNGHAHYGVFCHSKANA